MYNFNHLYYFYITAKSDSVTHAAEHLSISQPSLTSQIRVLEEQLNIKLFKKVGRRNQLTEGGAIVLGYCKRMFEISEEMSDFVLRGLPTATRRIYIGVSDDVERSFVVEAVSKFFKKQSLKVRPHVTIVSGTQEELTEKLKFREIDVVVTETAVTDPELMNLAKAESPVVLVCSYNSIKKDKTIKIKNKINERFSFSTNSNSHWLMPSKRFKLRSETDRFFEDHEIKGRVVFESDVLSSLVQSVVDDIGVAFLPKLYVKSQLNKKSIRVIGSKSGHWIYKLWLVCDPSSSNDDLIKAFSSAFTSTAGTTRK